MGIYVTDNGFQKKTLAELKTEREGVYKSIFGNDIDLSSEGPFGQIIGIESQIEANLWDAMEEIYLSRDPDQATGVSLTKIARETGTERQDAEPTFVNNAILYGDNLTTVELGKKVYRNTDPDANPITFTLTENVLISLDNAKEIQLEIPDEIVESENYTVTINSTPYTYAALAGDDKNDVIDGIAVLIDALAGFNALNIGEILLISFTGTFFEASFSANMELNKLGSAGDFEADIPGPYPVPENSLTKILTPVSGWDSISNPSAGTTGSSPESDEALRIRRIQELTSGKATDSAIKNAVVNVLNVIGVSVVSNRTDSTDGEGRPPHSFEIIATGGNVDDIAQAIFDAMPSGIQPYGNSSGTAYDEDSNSYTIYFSRPTTTYVWVRVSRDFNSEETYPADGDQAIKDAIFQYSLDFINTGTDIIRQRLSKPIYSVQGIGDIIIELAETPTPGGTPVYAQINIIVGASIYPEFSTDRMTVQDIP